MNKSILLTLIGLISLTSYGCAGQVNSPTLGQSYDASKTNKPYREEGTPPDDCDILTPEQRKSSGGCVDYETINKIDGRK
jgi:hypothetical protein